MLKGFCEPVLVVEREMHPPVDTLAQSYFYGGIRGLVAERQLQMTLPLYPLVHS